MSPFIELYEVKQLPVFQNRTFETKQEAVSCTKGDILLVQDVNTGLIYNRDFLPELMQYDQDYQNEQALSGVFRAHLDEVASIIGQYFYGDKLIEVGCGKGFFLEYMLRKGFNIIGMDPAYDGENPYIIKSLFQPGLGFSGDGIVLRHVLEHVQDPLDFLSKLKQSNGGKGKIYIEVPCFDWICERRAWFDIFYEHVNYFRLGDLSRMFGRVYAQGQLFSGQYIYIVADLSTLRVPECSAADVVNFPADMLASIGRFAEQVKRHENSGCGAAIWGGASKGVIFALFMHRAGACIDVVIDINPAKQGKYLGVSGLEVHSPAHAMSLLGSEAELFVMNSNYMEEIAIMTGNKYNLIAIDT